MTTTTPSSPTPAGRIDPTARRVPPMGGFNRTLLGIELFRVLRNRRTLVFALVLPAALFFVFGSGGGGDRRMGEGNLSAYVMVSMALYGGALIAASTGSGVAIERAQGWSRQLRLTPLNPLVYVLVKAIVALATGALAVTVVNLIGVAQGTPDMPVTTWLECAALSLVCTLTFAALGVFVGYLVPGENAMQVLGPGLALLSFLGGLFIPLSEYSEVVRQIAYWTPMYGVAEVARAPLTHELPWYAVVNALVWLALFVAGAVWRLARDTRRV